MAVDVTASPAAPQVAYRGVVIIAISSVFFALMATLARTVSAQVSWAQLVTLRHSIGLVGIASWFIATHRRPMLQRPWPLLLRGVFGGGAVLSYFFAIATLGAAPATVLNYVSPVYAAIWAVVFLKEKPSLFTWVGLVVATAGAAVVTLASGAGAGSDWVLGAAAGIASGIFGGAAMTAVKAAREDSDAATVFLSFCVVGALMALPFALHDWRPIALETAWRIGALGILALTAQLMFTWGMGHTSATLGSATTQLVPAFAWLFSATLLGERVTGLSLLGAGLCVAGVVIGVLRRR